MGQIHGKLGGSTADVTPSPVSPLLSPHADGLLLGGGWGLRASSRSEGWLLLVITTGSSTTLMLLHCISSCSRLKISSAREHLKAKIPARAREEGQRGKEVILL